MTRRTSEAVAKRNAVVVQRIQTLKAAHPFWGYRRIWAHLRFVDGLLVNKKQVLRLMRQHGLLVKANPRLKATRTPSRSKPRPTAPQQWWGIDMTKVLGNPSDGSMSWSCWTGTPRRSSVIMLGSSQEQSLAHGVGAGGVTPIPGGGPGPGALADERQWVSAHINRVHEDVCDAWDHAGLHK